MQIVIPNRPVKLGMSGQVETGEEFLDQTHPRIRWQRKRLVKYLIGNDSHISPPLADIEPQKETGCKSLSRNARRAPLSVFQNHVSTAHAESGYDFDWAVNRDLLHGQMGGVRF